MVKIKWDIFVWDTLSSFRSIQRYFELVESQIKKVKDEEWEQLQQLPVPRDEEEYQTEYAPEIGAHKHEYEEVLPRLVSYSFVLMLFSELEFRINEICRVLKKRENVPLKINDFKGNLIERFTKFLIIANKSQLEKNDRDEIDNFVVVRNCIAHNNGFLSNFKDAKKLSNIAKTERHLEIDGRGENARILVLSGFLYSRFEFFMEMFKRLFDSLNFGPEIPIILDKEQS